MMKRKAKILFVSKTADWVGPTNSLLLLLKYLRESYDVTVLLPGEGLFTETLTTEGIPFVSFPSLSKRAIHSIFRLIRREKFDLVYGNTAHGSSRNALVASKLARVPFVCHVRELGWGKSWLKNGYLRFTDANIVVSEACSASIARFAHHNKRHIIYNGVILNEHELDANGDSADIPVPVRSSSRDFVIVTVGYVCARKGQKYAVEAMAEIVKTLPYAKLLIIGSLDRDRNTGYVDKVRSMIREMKLDDNVSLLGFRNDVQQCLRRADILLHTAVKDPHPRVVIEAMVENLPVVGFDVDGVTETVMHGTTGYLAPPGDVPEITAAILKLAADPSMRKRMGNAGNRLVETRFSARVTAEKVAGVISQIIGGNPTEGGRKIVQS